MHVLRARLTVLTRQKGASAVQPVSRCRLGLSFLQAAQMPLSQYVAVWVLGQAQLDVQAAPAPAPHTACTGEGLLFLFAPWS